MAIFCGIVLGVAFIVGQILQYVTYSANGEVFLLQNLLSLMKISQGSNIFLLVISTGLNIGAVALVCSVMYTWIEEAYAMSVTEKLSIFFLMLIFTLALILFPLLSWLLLFIAGIVIINLKIERNISYAGLISSSIMLSIGGVICVVIVKNSDAIGSAFNKFFDNIKAGITNMVGDKHEHTYGDWEVLVKPTCTSEGKRGKYCKECDEWGMEEVLAIDDANHIQMKWTTEKNATCLSTGIKYADCLDCGKRVKAEIIPAHPNRLIIEAKSATCTQEGSTEHNECTDCGEVFLMGETVPALGHNWVDREEISPTCVDYGWTYGVQCSNCNEWYIESKQIEKVDHQIFVGEAIEATCLNGGETPESYCEFCGVVFSERTPTAALGHTYDMYTNTCVRCPVKEYPEIISSDALGKGEPKMVIYLDYILDSSQHGTWTFSSSMEYVRLVGTAGKKYPLTIKILDRTTPFSMDLVNVSLRGNSGPTVISESSSALNLGFYGKESAIKGATGSNGTNGGPFRDAGNGQIAVQVKGSLNITVSGEKCSILGGNGGRGGNGSIGNDGGRGGNGAMAISAGSITVSCKEAYTTSNLHITGGSGGDGGAAGAWFFGQPSAGASGSAAKATNVDILYQ